MEAKIKKLLEFNGPDGKSRNIYFLNVDGQYWVALKPIIETLGINWKAQHQALKNNKFLSLVSSNQWIPDARNHVQEMTCLPEKYVYGWLFKLQSTAPGFEEFQMKCYELLYDYFHGTIARRISTLEGKTADEMELEKLLTEQAGSETAKKIEHLRSRIKIHRRKLVDLDTELSSTQLDIF